MLSAPSPQADADRKAEILKKKQRLEELRRSREERASRRQEQRSSVGEALCDFSSETARQLPRGEWDGARGMSRDKGIGEATYGDQRGTRKQDMNENQA